MHQALAVLRRHPQRFGGAERLLVEFDRGIGVVDDEMRRDDLHGISHFGLLDFLNHPMMTNGEAWCRQGKEDSLCGCTSFRSPLPLCGEGRGWGSTRAIPMWLPPPRPSPARGEGANLSTLQRHHHIDRAL